MYSPIDWTVTILNSKQFERVVVIFFFQAEDGIRDVAVTGVQTCALPILELEFAVLEVCEDGGEEERAPLIALFAGLVHRGAEPLGQARHVRPGACAGSYGAPRPSFACVARSAARNDTACASRPGSPPSHPLGNCDGHKNLARPSAGGNPSRSTGVDATPAATSSAGRPAGGGVDGTPSARRRGSCSPPRDTHDPRFRPRAPGRARSRAACRATPRPSCR